MARSLQARAIRRGLPVAPLLPDGAPRPRLHRPTRGPARKAELRWVGSRSLNTGNHCLALPEAPRRKPPRGPGAEVPPGMSGTQSARAVGAAVGPPVFSPTAPPPPLAGTRSASSEARPLSPCVLRGDNDKNPLRDRTEVPGGGSNRAWTQALRTGLGCGLRDVRDPVRRGGRRARSTQRTEFSFFLHSQIFKNPIAAA